MTARPYIAIPKTSMQRLPAVALGDTGSTPTQDQASLNNERERLEIVLNSPNSPSGSPISPRELQLHITSILSETFDIREVGFYINAYNDPGADPVLLAVYSDPITAMSKKSADIDLLLSFELILSALPDNSVAFPSDLPSTDVIRATTGTAGSVSLASVEEVIAGEIDTKAITTRVWNDQVSDTATPNHLIQSLGDNTLSPSWIETLGPEKFTPADITDEKLDGVIISSDNIQDDSISNAKLSTIISDSPIAGAIPITSAAHMHLDNWIPNNYTDNLREELDVNHLAQNVAILSDPNLMIIRTQSEFNDVFNLGPDTPIAAGTSILLCPISDTVANDINEGAWGGTGDADQNTLNGLPGYRLTNSVLLNSDVRIIGLNPRATIVVKTAPGVRFIIQGTSGNTIRNIVLEGWTFDGRGGIYQDDTQLLDWGGTITETESGGAFLLEYVRDCQLNCHIVNHKTDNSAAGVQGSYASFQAHHMYSCETDEIGGAVFNCYESDLKGLLLPGICTDG